MDQDILAPEEAEKNNYKETDVFAWVNNVIEFKGELKVELFLISRTFMLYRTSLTAGLKSQLEPLFVDNILEHVLDGAEKGMIVRGFEEAESEDGVLQRTQVFKVDKARAVLNFLKTQEQEIEVFNDDEHDFGRMKGILARISHPDMKQTAYVMKVLPRGNVMQGKTGWMMRGGKFVPFDADAALRIPADNQLMVIDQDMYVFSQNSLRQLFGYDAKEASIAENKVKEIDANFRLVYPEGTTLQDLVAGKKAMIKKLQKLEPGSIKQEELMSHASDLGIDLMEDNTGAIIIVDDKDMNKFVNLLNDDYMESPLTGQRYEIVRKKLLKLDEDGEQPTSP